jgi:DNA-binding beta-propeller fold protein YncE
MKKIFLLLAILWVSLNSYSQDPPAYIQQDTLSGGMILITVQPEGGLWSQYLLTDSTENIISGTYHADNSSQQFMGEDYLISNITSPDNFGGCLPLDVCYNSIQNKLYFYGGQNIIVVDALTNIKTKEIQVSETFDYLYSGGVRLKNQHNLVYNPQYNKIFCATLSADLVIIDCDTDEIVSTINLPDIYNFHSTSLAMDHAGDFVYWYVNDYFMHRYLNKVSCQTNITVLQRDFYPGIYDIVCDKNEDILYLSTFSNPTTKIHAINTNNLQTIAQFGKSEMGKMIVNDATNTLYAADLETNRVLAYDLTTYGLVNTIDVSLEILLQSFCNINENLIYFSGVNGLSIIDGTIGQEVKFYPDEWIANGLLYDEVLNVACFGSRGNITTIDGTNNQIIDVVSNEGGTSVRLIAGADSSVISANLNEGTATIFDFQTHNDSKQLVLNSVVQLGGSMAKGCYNEINEKVYYMQHSSSNHHSYLTIYDANTLSNIAEVPLAPTLRDIQYNKFNNKVYLTSYDKKMIIPIDGVTNQILEDEIIHLQYNPVDIFISSLNKIYVSTHNYVLIYDGETHQLLNSIYAFTAKFEENVSLQIVYAIQAVRYKITAIDAVTNEKIADIPVNGTMPRDVCYNSSSKTIYVAYQDADEILEISGTTILSAISGVDDVTFVEYNYLEDKLYAISSSSMYVIKRNTIHKVIDLSGLCMGLVFNPNNNKMYTHQYYGNDFYANITAIDCDTDEIVSIVQLPQKQKPGISAIVLINDLVFSKNTNRLFCGTRSFSSICALQCNSEHLGLRNGWNWKSFPRLERTDNNPAPVIPVLERINYFPNVYLTLEDDFNRTVTWNYNGWTAGFEDVTSTSGYQLDLELTDAESPHVILYGARLDPATPITLNAGEENWIGYFIPEAQMPLDAFPAATLELITSIKAQDWAMIRQEADPEWRYKGRVMPIRYGDMVKVTVSQSNSFSWNQPAEAVEEMALLVPEYYSYEEQADYLPIFVETDSTSDIQEIAVLANGEVRGAAVREPGDTLVQVSAYLQGVPEGTPLSFETWSGFKSAPAGSGSYAVFDPLDKKYENRTLYKGENAPYHAVSLKSGANAVTPDRRVEVSCAPNPSTGETTFTIRMEEMAKVTLMIRDINGRSIATLLDNEMPKGLYHIKWYGAHDNGSDTVNGVYFYSLSMNGHPQSSGKIVLIR